MPIVAIREVEFQQRALERFDLFLQALEEPRAKYEKGLKVKLEHPDVDLQLKDFAAEAWEYLRINRLVGRPDKPYSLRETGDRQPVPNCTFKLPTGGGKTYLAAAAVARLMTQYVRGDEIKFVLWVVPSEAIYAQTKANLSDREHPYRQLLDRVSGGRVRILEKDSPLDARDLVGQLSVMLLMLPSANRETKEALRIFRDRGNVNGFLPDDDDRPAHEKLWKQVPNLDYVQQGVFGDPSVGLIRSSLGNALRLLRPVIVMDEGQKAFSPLAYQTLYGFNPRFLLELSATPKDATERWSNWLTDIRGTDLEKEQMIKMPLILHAEESTDWRDCLRKALERTKELQAAADRLRDDTNRYIRPILLVQVERTGKSHEDGKEVHAEQARAHLISLGLEPEAVRLKTAEVNEIQGLDLLATDCPVRAIITKSALQEGWDCPFAYVLCSLIPVTSISAMTQMVGRILRQPHASDTGMELLDQCYVFTNFAQTARVFEAIKKGLEGEGMGDLAGKIKLSSGEREGPQVLERKRRDAFANLDYYLPKVTIADRNGLREIDWESDILGEIDWSAIDVSEQAKGLAKTLDTAWGSTVAIGLDILKGQRGTTVESSPLAPDKFNLTYAVRVLGKDVPNPFIGARIIKGFLDVLRSEGWTEEELGLQQRYVTERIVAHTKSQIEAACRKVFVEALASHKIRFNLRAPAGVWQVPEEDPITVSGLLGRDDGNNWQFNLFDPVQKTELNGFEYKVASYIDKSQALEWWYRNVAREGGYALQGWRKNRMYPDFILAKRRGGNHEWVVLETKGEHLERYHDTEYKEALVKALVEAYESQRNLPAVGELELVGEGQTFDCRILMETGWEQSLAALLTHTD